MKKYVMALCGLALLCCLVIDNKGRESVDYYSIKTVQSLLNEESLGVTTGEGSKIRHRLGDRVSVALLKILSEGDLKNPQKVKMILPLIRSCFLYPNFIEIPEDKSPKVTLFLLRYFETVAVDTVLKNEISETMKFVKDKTREVK
jgi:hypothetical protein